MHGVIFFSLQGVRSRGGQVCVESITTAIEISKLYGVPPCWELTDCVSDKGRVDEANRFPLYQFHWRKR